MQIIFSGSPLKRENWSPAPASDQPNKKGGSADPSVGYSARIPRSQARLLAGQVTTPRVHPTGPGVPDAPLLLPAHLSPFGPRGSSPRIPQSRTSACGGFIGSDLLTLVGLTAPGSTRPDGSAVPQPVPLLQQIGIRLSRVFEKFLGSQSAIPRGSRLLQSDQRLAGLAVLGYNSLGKDCAHPHGVPWLGSLGRPSEGLGSASPPDMIMIPHLGSDVKRFSEDFSNFFSWIPQLTQKPVVRAAHDRLNKKRAVRLCITGSGASSFPGFEGLTRATCALAIGFCLPGAY